MLGTTVEDLLIGREGYFDFSIAASRFCSESIEVTVHSSSTVGISRSHNKVIKDESNSSRGKASQHCLQVQGASGEEGGNCKRTIKALGEVELLYSSSSPI